jgi:CheY-like chemotaxis protein/glycine cleavage system H lipoate-binding protein
MKAPRDILAVDDEDVVVESVAKICGSEGLTVEGAASGSAGLEKLEERPFRLVLCDIMMEDLDGFEFLDEAMRRGRRVPIVMTTGYTTVENAVRSVACGAIDFLAKPFTADELLAVVRRSLHYGRLAEGPDAGATRRCPAPFHRLGYVSWAALEPEGVARIGLCDLFVRTLNGIRGAHLAPAGAELVQGRECASMTSADGLAHAVLCPVSGRVLEANAAVEKDPALVERDPYGGGWLYRVLPDDLEYNLGLLSPRGAGGAR